MPYFARLSIRHKLMMIIGLTSGAALLAASATFLAQDLLSLKRKMVRDIGVLARLIGSNSSAALLFQDAMAAQEILGGLAAQPGVTAAVLYDSKGVAFVQYARDPGPAPAAALAWPGHRFLPGRLQALEEIHLDGERIGSIFVESDLEELRERLRQHAVVTLVVTLASIGLALLLAHRLQKVISRPLAAMAGVAAEIGSGHMAARMPVDSADEVGVLARAFNRMLDDLGATTVSKRYVDNIIHSMADTLIVTSPEGTIQSVNEALLLLLDYEEAQILGRSIDTVAEGAIGVDVLQQRGFLSNLELTYAARDGRRIPVSVSASALREDDGRIAGVVLVAQDVTERKRAEEALLSATQAAIEASRAKSEFLANMSHEIRTPMNGIIGMTELLIDTPLNGEQRSFLEAVRESARSLMTIINDILDFSKIEAGRLDLEAIPFNLPSAIGDTVKSLGLRAHQKGLELLLEIAPDVPERVIGDPGRLRQILVNLLGNAIKFTERGEVTARVSVDSAAPGAAMLLFEVIDTGIGVPPEKLGVIFEPFRQVDGSTTRRYGGTGLGLTISTQLVGMMGGAIGVESRPGQGSRFHFTVRLELPREEAAAPPDPAETRLAGLRVLVVDDNESNRRILSTCLSRLGMRTETVGDAMQALARLRDAGSSGDPFRLAIVDVRMPGVDGFQLAGMMRQDARLSGIPILLTPSVGLPGEGARCREIGIEGYLTKPFSSSELREAMLAILSGAPRREDPPVTRHSLRETARGRRILLAEDNPVNQTVALRVLQKLGHQVVLAGNGAEAVRACTSAPFDAILMDVQMPEMDGLEATARIREMERGSGRHVPIIALTAHARKEDQEQCIRAGMDGYLSKPFQPEALAQQLDRLAGRSLPDPAAYDRAVLLDRLGGDGTLMAELIRTFLATSPGMLEEIREGIRLMEPVKVQRAAHKLKGSLLAIAAKEAEELARRLETVGQAGDLVAAAGDLAALEAEMSRLSRALATSAPEGQS